MALAVGKVELGRELMSTLRDINASIEEVKDQAHSRGIKPEHLKDHYGQNKMAPLLAGKAQCLHALVLMNQDK